MDRGSWLDSLSERPVHAATGAALLTIVLFSLLAWSLGGMYRSFRTLEMDVDRSQHLVDRLEFLDEALTMSAYMAASTGDTLWVVRYRRFEREYGDRLAEMLRRAPEVGEAAAAAQVQAAGDALFAAEAAAFDSIRAGRSGAAWTLLTGDSYQRRKAAYAAGVGRIRRGIEAHTAAERDRFREGITTGVAVAGITLVGLLFVGLFLRAVVGRYVSIREASASTSRLLTSIIESTDDAVVSKTLDGTILSWNGGAAGLYGYSAEEAVGRSVYDLVPPELADDETEILRRIRQGERIRRYDTERLTRDGRRISVSLSAAPILDGDGRVTAVASISRDVTREKEAARELAASRAELDALVRSMSDVILVLDAEGRYVAIPETGAPLLYRPPDALLGKRMHDVLPPEAADFFLAHVRRALESGGTVQVEYSLPIDDRPVWFSAAVSPMSDDRVVWVARDITERRRAEEELRKAKQAAEAASEAKSDFLSSMSHELRTPLNSVIGFANVLRKNKAGNLREQDVSYLERILANGKHLLGLINDILDLSKIEAGKVELQIEPVALDAVVRSTVEELQGSLGGKPVELRAELPATLAPIETDGARLKQVLINLVGNAVKFTERGEVRVVVHEDPLTGSPTRLDVIDTGIGIPPDRLASIFDPFVQAEQGTARMYGGTGLGLAISRSIVELLGYRLEVSSAVGEGSTFSIVLTPEPASRPSAETVVTRPAPSEEPGGALPAPRRADDFTGKLVLVIDDETDARILLTEHIEEFGCRVVAASSGEQGLRIARELKPDLITVDLLMPGMDGWETLRRIRTDPELGSIPAAVVSIVAEEKRATMLGAVDFLEKPVERGALLDMLHRHLGAGVRKVLVVDDEADSRTLLAHHLDVAEIEVRLAEGGEEALRMLEDYRPDLIVLDLMMPTMDGVEFLRVLRDRPAHRDIPVVIVTAKEMSREEAGAIGREVMAVLHKDGELESELRNLLREIWKRI